MRSAAAACQIEYQVIRAAKAAGAPGFQAAGRVDMRLLKPWLDVNAATLQANTQENTREYWSLERLKYQAKREQFAYESDQGAYIARTDADANLAALAAATKAVLRARLETELPQKIQGLGPIELQAVLTRTVDEICEVFQGGVDQWK